MAIAARRTDGLGDQIIQYCDQEGDWIHVGSDAEVAEMFAAGLAARPVPLPVRFCTPAIGSYRAFIIHTVYVGSSCGCPGVR